jgi:hypothetical protein
MQSTINAIGGAMHNGYFQDEIDMSPSRISVENESVKPIRYYMLRKEPYLGNLTESNDLATKSPILKKIK